MPRDELAEADELAALEEYSESIIEPFYQERKQSSYLAGKAKNRRPPAKVIPPPDTLTEALAEQLGRKGMRTMAQSLIQLTKGPRPSLDAIKYVFDRLEGKPRQSVVQSRDQDDPLLELLGKLMENDKQLDTPAPAGLLAEPVSEIESYIEAEVREADSEETGA